MQPPALLESAAVLLASPDLQAGIAGLAELLKKRLTVLRFGIAVVQPGAPWLRVLEAHGDGHGPAAGAGGRMPMQGTANGQVVRTGEAWVNLDLGATAEQTEERKVREAGAVAYFCYPARFGTEVVGTLNLALVELPEDLDDLRRDLEQLGDLVGAALERHRLESEVQRLAGALRRRNAALSAELDRLGGMQPVAESPTFRRVLSQVERVAVSDATTLLLGDTGTGKEILARYLHRMSPRAEGPFLAVNCAALPEGLVESELFGVRRGAFTGAEKDRAGFFEQASGGSLLLDEVGDLPLGVQAKLLRVLQDGVVTPVGGTQSIRVDVRLIAATHRDLPLMIRAEAFREDLYHRLATIPIRVPALADRREDIPLLVREFVRSACARMSRPEPTISPGVLRALSERSYPGNVRELRNLVERALVFSSEAFVLPEEELPRIGDAQDAPSEAAWPTLAAAQIAHIRATLLRTGGKIHGADGAAALLGLPPSTLRSRMSRLGIT